LKNHYNRIGGWGHRLLYQGL